MSLKSAKSPSITLAIVDWSHFAHEELSTEVNIHYVRSSPEQQSPLVEVSLSANQQAALPHMGSGQLLGVSNAPCVQQ